MKVAGSLETLDAVIEADRKVRFFMLFLFLDLCS